MAQAKVPTELINVLKRILNDGGSGNFIVMEEPVTGYYVQVAAGKGDRTMHLEAVGNEYLPDDRQLADTQETALTRLGWNRPGGDLRNFSQDRQSSTDQQLQDIMDMIITTFQEVYRVDFGAVNITVTLE